MVPTASSTLGRLLPHAPLWMLSLARQTVRVGTLRLPEVQRDTPVRAGGVGPRLFVDGAPLSLEFGRKKPPAQGASDTEIDYATRALFPCRSPR